MAADDMVFSTPTYLQNFLEEIYRDPREWEQIKAELQKRMELARAANQYGGLGARDQLAGRTSLERLFRSELNYPQPGMIGSGGRAIERLMSENKTPMHRIGY